MNRRLLLFMTGLLVFGLVLEAYVAERISDEQHATALRAQVQNDLARFRNALEGNLNSNIQLARGLVGVVALQPDLGQEGFALSTSDVVRVRQTRRPLRLVRAATRNYFSVLRQKLKWAER